MAKLIDVLALRPITEQALFEESLKLLIGHRAITSQAYHNIEAESRLPEAAWNEIIDLVLSNGKNSESTQDAVRSVCRRWILSGPEIPSLQSNTFARAVTVDAMVSLLRKSHPGRGKDFAWREVRDLWTKPLGITKARWGSRNLGMYLMWGTFTPGEKSPCHGLPKAADSVRRILGLDPRLAKKPLLLFEYKLSSGAMPRYPTVADAYAGNEWSYFFRPAPAGEPHGWIMPWPDYAGKTKPRPEVVHSVVQGDCLVSSPKRLE